MKGSKRIRSAVLASVLLVLTGCVPIPVPPMGDWAGSRRNLSDQVPEFIVIGKTTRAEVLLVLGEPDQTTDNDRQFIYRRLSQEGGIAFMYGGGGRGGVTGVPVTLRVLSLNFNENGAVSDARVGKRVERDFGPLLTPMLYDNPASTESEATPPN